MLVLAQPHNKGPVKGDEDERVWGLHGQMW